MLEWKMSRLPQTAKQYTVGTSKSAQTLNPLVCFLEAPGWDIGLGTDHPDCGFLWLPQSPPNGPDHIYGETYSYQVKHNLLSIANQPAHTI